MPRTNEQAAVYMRDYRAKKAAERRAAAAAAEDEQEGEVERTVREACAGWPKAQEQPETVAIAIELARVLDHGSSSAKVTASSQLTRILDTLRGGSTRGKLAQLRDGAIRERDS